MQAVASKQAAACGTEVSHNGRDNKFVHPRRDQGCAGEPEQFWFEHGEDDFVEAGAGEGGVEGGGETDGGHESEEGA